MSINKVEQGRAEYAYKAALNAKNSLSKASEYKSYVKKIPMLIKTNGLGAAFAFVFSKGSEGGVVNSKSPYGLIYNQVADWLINYKPYLVPTLSNKQDLAKEVMELDSNMYRALTVEVLALFNWLRRFAEGLI